MRPYIVIVSVLSTAILTACADPNQGPEGSAAADALHRASKAPTWQPNVKWISGTMGGTAYREPAYEHVITKEANVLPIIKEAPVLPPPVVRTEQLDVPSQVAAPPPAPLPPKKIKPVKKVKRPASAHKQPVSKTKYRCIPVKSGN